MHTYYFRSNTIHKLQYIFFILAMFSVSTFWTNIKCYCWPTWYVVNVIAIICKKRTSNMLNTVMAPPSKLSVIWFEETERATATAIAALSNTFGYCFAFLIGPLIVTVSKYILILQNKISM